MADAATKERQILFSAPMVRAVLAGTKTQTRRVVKAQPQHVDGGVPFGDPPAYAVRDGAARGSAVMRCPYGKRGDQLWVKESWAWSGDTEIPENERRLRGEVWYRADPERSSPAIRWRSSLFMPRWASRITLEVTGVRVERLQDISVGDATAEGWQKEPTRSKDAEVHRDAARDWYADLWESINGPGSWDANPWVWVVGFRRVEGMEA